MHRFLVIVLALWATACRPEPSERAEPETVVFLVRHAEKVDDSRDPELSEAGIRRAARLADVLASAGIDRVFSTDFIRTRETARPVAERLGLEVQLYEEVEALATRLASGTGRVLVVGHSNTTPELVELLGGDPGEPIAEDEYDRLYIVSYAPGPGGPGRAETVLLRLPGTQR